ncbi:carboxypeptidase-like regulatory domain-containing protein [Chryseobacterium sp. R2A-55]|uniref:carboxypeptidase-like regulatory domain-containing protein n=1 Tax=Chryseobacterium sp. R2A-55 TaxID=2744445 RepID=UPI001F1ABB44|nr:carboxypeptidase-like regulatory domain-containing protein [Chryseobacterium sp. R2A-55]
MKTLYITALLFLLSIFSISCSEDLVGKVTTATITGKVVKKGTNTPLANVKIYTAPTTETVFSATDGTFKLENIPLGDYSVKAELTGYLATFLGVNLKTENTVSIVFELSDDNSLNSPPSIPQLLTPADNSENQPTSVTLTWSCADPDPADSLKLNFRVIVKNSLNSTIFEKANIKTKYYVLENLKFGVSYFWQVAANDTVNPEVFSAVQQFKVTAIPNNRFHYVRKSGSNSYIMSSNEAGQDFPLTSIGVNSWRPRLQNDAGLVAYLQTVSGSTHIFTSKRDGSDVKQVTFSQPVSGSNPSELDFSWNSTGSEIIYPVFNKLYRINKDGTGLTLIYTTTDGSFITKCDWSSDGSKIALKTNDINGYNARIFIIDPLGNVLKTILENQSGAAGGLNFSITGDKLLFTRDVSGYENENHRQLDSRIFLYDLTTNIATDLSQISKKPIGTNDLDPRFSPNNAEVIFMNTSNDGISQKNIVKLTFDNTNTEYPRIQLFSDGEMPDWK